MPKSNDEERNLDEEVEQTAQKLLEEIELTEEKPVEPEYFLELIELTPDSIGDEDENGNHVVPDYAKELGDREAVSGDIHCLQLEIRNVGDESFPGGAIDKIALSSGFNTYTYPKSKTDIPELEPDEESEVSIHMHIGVEGAVTFKGKVKSSDDSLVQIEGSEPEPDELTFGLRAVPRENLQILKALEELKEVITDVRH